MSKKAEAWYFTFMQSQHDLKDKYVRIEGSYKEARDKMFDMFGSNWAFQYSEDVFLEQASKYNLTELELN